MPPRRIAPEELARILGSPHLVVMAAELRRAPFVIGEGGAWWVRADHVPAWRSLFEELFAPA